MVVAVVGVPSQPGLALPSVTDVASSRTRVRSDTPMPLSDVGQRGVKFVYAGMQLGNWNTCPLTLSASWSGS